MIVKLVKNLALFATLFLPLAAVAQANWQEGEHYTVLNTNASEDKRIREVFSFWCPHCFTFESIAKELKSQLPDDVTFIKAHANFMASASQQAQDDATKAMLAAKAMGKADEFNQALFEAIHNQRKSIEGMDEIIQVFADAGGDTDKLTKLANSFGIRSQVSKNDKLTQGIRSVPTFIVNDKYQANFTRNMTPDQFIQLLMWLTTQK